MSNSSLTLLALVVKGTAKTVQIGTVHCLVRTITITNKGELWQDIHNYKARNFTVVGEEAQYIHCNTLMPIVVNLIVRRGLLK